MNENVRKRLPPPPEGKGPRYYAMRTWTCQTCGSKFKARRTTKHGDRKTSAAHPHSSRE